MRKEQLSRISALLGEWRHGRESARGELVTVAYPELRRIAARYIREERPEHTLRTTELVNEMYLRLFGSAKGQWLSRAHFFAAVAREMRHILVDHARARQARKRPDRRLQVSIGDVEIPVREQGEDVLALDEALSRLEAVDARAGRAVELRYFAGLTEPEAAEALGISLATLKRDWSFARAWLLDQLRGGRDRE